jgi:UPF0271 protein
MRGVDLSCDLGEAADPRQQEIEDALWPLITSANVACGGHAGDASTMQHAVRMASRHGVNLGAHPSYPDRESFGRRSMKLPPDELQHSLVKQIRDLQSLAADGVRHVKPHGALYNDAHHDEELARTVVTAIVEADARLAVVSAASSALFRAAAAAGLPTIAEAFADRRYRRDGSLVPRSRPDALLLDVDAAAEQAVSLARSGTVIADDGSEILVPFATICVHGDMDGAVARLQKIRERLRRAGFHL